MASGSLLMRLLLVVGVALLPAVAFQIYAEVQARAARQQITQDEGMRLLLLVRAQTQRIFEGAEQMLTVIANTPVVQSHMPEGCKAMLVNLLKEQPRYLYADAMTLDGTPFCTPGQSDRKLNASDRSYFQRALASGAFTVGEFAIGRFSGVPSLHMARPYRDNDGNIAGVVEVALSLKWLNEQIAKIELPPDSIVGIGDRNGVILARHPGGMAFVGRPPSPDHAFLMEGNQIRTIDGMPALDTGRPKFVTLSPPGADPNGLTVVILLDQATAFAALARADRVGLTLIILGSLLALALTALIGQRLIRRPIAELIAVADQWRAGALGARTPLRDRRDEFGRLANAFNTMAETLELRERALRERGALLRAAFEQAAVGMVVADARQMPLQVNDKLCDITGYSREDLLRLWPDDITHPDDRIGARDSPSGVAAPVATTKRYIRKDGAAVWLNVIGSHLQAGDECPRRFFAVIEDVTERKRIETALAESEERLRLAMQAAALGVGELDLVTQQGSWSAEAARILGADQDGDTSFAGWNERLHPEDRPRVEAEWARALATPGYFYQSEYRYRLPDGAWRWIAAYGRMIFDGGRPVRGVCVIQDISARKRVEEALRDSEARLRMSHEVSRIGAWDWDLVTGKLYWSDMQCRQFGIDPVLSDTVTAETWRRAVHPDDLPGVEAKLRAEMAGAAPTDKEYRIIVDGQLRCLIARSQTIYDRSGNAVRMIGIDMDITQRRALEDELRRLTVDLEVRVQQEVAARDAAQTRAAHAERMQALGQLAGGIAHDFNNVLQAISGAVTLMERRLDNKTGLLRLIRLAAEATERGASITRRLLAFGRRGDLRSATIDPAALLNDLRDILVPTLGTTIGIEVKLETGLRTFIGDKSQLETTLINLATNARDAMPHGGTLLLSAAREMVAGDGPEHPESLDPGYYVRLSVRDSGIGMDAATLARASEPFFTTKSSGHGTGLGLAMSKGFAEQSGGAMRIESAPGQGTTVTLWLPETDPQELHAAAFPRELSAIGASRLAEPAQAARVLLVDDQDAVREVLELSLRDAGYSVLAASNGIEALALLSAGDRADAVVTDLSMPGMDGLALIRAVHAQHPKMPAILLTGYTGEGAALAVGQSVGGPFALLRKPVHGQQLVDCLAALLVGRVATAQ